jgi:S-DNA-T family DNA segregation ATPase FtsK/SpoIIIE
VGTVQFRRLPRLAAPKMPGGEVHLEPPPEVPRVIPGNIVQKTMPILMIVAVLGMVAYILLIPGQDRTNPMFLLFPIMMVVSTVGMFAGGRGASQAKAEMNEDRKDYLRYLGQMRERARESAREQRAALEWSHPDPAALWSIADSRRVWVRRSSDPDFCHVRICRGSQRLATRLVPPQTGPVDELEPITTLALRQFVRAHSIVPDLPIAISIRGFAAINISGELDHHPRPGRPARRGGHRRQGEGGLGMGEVAAARAAPEPRRRCWTNADDGLLAGPDRTTARRLSPGAATVRPQRPAVWRPGAHPDRHRRWGGQRC